jgi:hypothetical protein
LQRENLEKNRKYKNTIRTAKNLSLYRYSQSTSSDDRQKDVKEEVGHGKLPQEVEKYVEDMINLPQFPLTPIKEFKKVPESYQPRRHFETLNENKSHKALKHSAMTPEQQKLPQKVNKVLSGTQLPPTTVKQLNEVPGKSVHYKNRRNPEKRNYRESDVKTKVPAVIEQNIKEIMHLPEFPLSPNREFEEQNSEEPKPEEPTSSREHLIYTDWFDEHMKQMTAYFSLKGNKKKSVPSPKSKPEPKRRRTEIIEAPVTKRQKA